MSDFDEMLATVGAECHTAAGSKKKALQALSALLAAGVSGITENQVFDSLLARERLGSTGLGHGVAIPHGRLADLEAPTGAVLTLEQGVDFDAPDGQPVDVLFGLLVPEDCNDVHLRILAGLAEMLNDPGLREELRVHRQEDALREQLRAWRAPPGAA